MANTAIVLGVGASAGVGAALCRRFAKEGLHVLAAGRTQQKLDAVVEGIRSAGGEATAVVGDATVQSDTIALFAAAERLGGPPKIAVYNAGNNQFSPLLEMDEAFFTDLWKICALGGFFFGQEAARRMIPGGGGTLVFTGATASIRARPPFTAFASAKAAERAVAHGMAREFGAQGLHVGHVIIDGIIDGEQVNQRFPQIREAKGDDGMLHVDAIADAFWALHVQHRSAWTLELDLRPFKEQF
jgi:NAD(P)-dependent dehydrogenase (short-subunit alcohol dehydrogenase family)